jgi:ABC-type transporter Mla subunit MlaD
VAYFDESSGLQPGHQVRMIGRRAGIVTDVSLAVVNGRSRVRVAFELRPGEGLAWVDRLPADTKAQIVPGGMRSDPRLVLSQGVASESVPEGGEVLAESSGPRDDALTTYRRNLREFDEMIDKAVAIIEGPEVSKAMETVKVVGEKIAGAEPQIDSAMAGMPGMIESMDRLRADLDRARTNVAEAGGATEAALGSSLGSTDRAIVQVESLGEAVARTQESLSGLAASMESAASAFDGQGTERAGAQLRALAARLRASQEMSAGNPALFGDMPSRRFWRPYFHGDSFKPGNNQGGK